MRVGRIGRAFRESYHPWCTLMAKGHRIVPPIDDIRLSIPIATPIDPPTKKESPYVSISHEHPASLARRRLQAEANSCEDDADCKYCAEGYTSRSRLDNIAMPRLPHPLYPAGLRIILTTFAHRFERVGKDEYSQAYRPSVGS